MEAQLIGIGHLLPAYAYRELIPTSTSYAVNRALAGRSTLLLGCGRRGSASLAIRFSRRCLGLCGPGLRAFLRCRRWGRLRRLLLILWLRRCGCGCRWRGLWLPLQTLRRARRSFAGRRRRRRA